MKILIAIILTIGIFGGLIGFWIYSYYVNYEYERQVGAYIENAYEVNTPERMISEIMKAKEGMIKLGLTDEMYGAWIFKKPDNKMSWQYDFLDSIIERAVAVKDWRDKMEKSQEIETLGDVYEQKMDNLREFIKEGGRSDWIANDAWLLDKHFIVYFAEWISLIWIVLGGIILFIAWTIAKGSEEY